jgi:hypothetical protein
VTRGQVEGVDRSPHLECFMADCTICAADGWGGETCTCTQRQRLAAVECALVDLVADFRRKAEECFLWLFHDGFDRIASRLDG